MDSILSISRANISELLLKNPYYKAVGEDSDIFKEEVNNYLVVLNREPVLTLRLLNTLDTGVALQINLITTYNKEILTLKEVLSTLYDFYLDMYNDLDTGLVYNVETFASDILPKFKSLYGNYNLNIGSVSHLTTFLNKSGIQELILSGNWLFDKDGVYLISFINYMLYAQYQAYTITNRETSISVENEFNFYEIRIMLDQEFWYQDFYSKYKDYYITGRILLLLMLLMYEQNISYNNIKRLSINGIPICKELNNILIGSEYKQDSLSGLDMDLKFKKLYGNKFHMSNYKLKYGVYERPEIDKVEMINILYNLYQQIEQIICS